METVPVAAGTVADVMTRCPVSVPADLSFAAVAAVLARSGVSAVPVLDDGGHPVGVVSEADLIRERGNGAGRTARDLMSGPVRAVDVGAPLHTASRLLAGARVRRLFVTGHGRLVGVLSRRDLLKNYLLDDDAVREQVRRVLPPAGCGHLGVTVRDGVVLLLGRLEWRSEVAAAERRVRTVPGVVDVRNRLGFAFDDGPPRRTATGPPPA
jgi:CBS domain-containing protein